MTITTKFNIGDTVWYKNKGYIYKGTVHQISIKRLGSIKIFYEVICDYAPMQCLAEHEIHLSQDEL